MASRTLKIGYPSPGTYSLTAQQGSYNLSGQNSGLTYSGGDPLNLPLYDTSKVSYLGRFAVPQSGGANHEGFKYAPDQGGGAIAFNPDGNGGLGSLFVGGTTVNNNRHTTVIAEISIPTPKTSGTLNTATLLQDFVAKCEGNDFTVGTTSQQGMMMTGLMVYNGRLIMTAAGWYMNNEDQTYSAQATSSLNLASSTKLGPYKIGSLTQQRVVGVGMGCHVPSNWQSTFGGYTAIIGGAGNVSTGNDTSSGPQICFFNPDDLTGSNASAKPGVHGVYYKPLNTIGVFAPGTGDEIVTGMSTHRGTAWPGETRTIMCYGCHGEAFYDINGVITGTGVQGTYSRSLWDRFWLYDAQDIKDAFDGVIPANDGPQPYGVLDLNFCLRNNKIGASNSGQTYVSELEQVRGGTWDPVGRKFYVVEHGSSATDYFPIIHVLSFGV